MRCAALVCGPMLALVVGCTPAGEAHGTAPISGAVASSSAGAGGADGSGGAGATSSGVSIGSSSSVASVAASTSNASGSSGSGSGAPWECDEDLAYRATSTAFSYPTPEPLAAALAELTYDPATNPLSFVLHVDSGILMAALSATVVSSGGDVFPAKRVPAFAPVVAADGQGVTTVGPQPTASLQVQDTQGPVSIAIEHLVWSATEYASCNLIWVDVQAVVPHTEYATVLHLAGGDRAIGALVEGAPADPGDAGDGIEAGPSDGPDGGGGGPRASLHFVFQGVPTAFDFTTLEGAP